MYGSARSNGATCPGCTSCNSTRSRTGWRPPPAAAEGSPELAGEYASLSARTTFFPSRHFLGDPRPLLARGGKTVLLVCTCGCEGCWDFVGRITVTDQTVTWGEFEQVHRDWSYAALGTFVFDRRQYEAELRFPAMAVGNPANPEAP
jgi:hypothetical protein